MLKQSYYLEDGVFRYSVQKNEKLVDFLHEEVEDNDSELIIKPSTTITDWLFYSSKFSTSY